MTHVFIIEINTDCKALCYRIYARQKFLNNALAPDSVYPVTNALTIGIYYYSKVKVTEQF